jgi:hypothetical protein
MLLNSVGILPSGVRFLPGNSVDGAGCDRVVHHPHIVVVGVLDAREPLIVELKIRTVRHRDTCAASDASAIHVWFFEQAGESGDFGEIERHKVANYRDITILRKYEIPEHIAKKARPEHPQLDL